MKTLRVELFLIADLDCTEELLNTLMAEYGGYTLIRAEGAWQDADCDVVEDDVVIATLFVADTPDNRGSIEELMQDYKDDADQDCVLYVLNGNNAIFIKD